MNNAGRDMSNIGGSYAPLLQPGLHAMTLQEVHDLCVLPYALSKRRQMIFDGLSGFLAELSKSNIAGTAWIDGSFLTEKIDPDDCDLVFCIDGPTIDSAPQTLVEAVERLFNRERALIKAMHHCDAYLRVEYPAGHAQHERGQQMRSYWRGQFCFDRNDLPKGLAVVTWPPAPPAALPALAVVPPAADSPQPGTLPPAEPQT